MTSTLHLPPYIEVEDILEQAHLPVSPSECHGLLTGMLCVARTREFAIERICELLPEQSENLPEFDVLQRLLNELTTIILQQLTDPELGFRLLLPDDETSIQTRSKEIGHWAAAFVSGFGEAGALNTEEAEDSVLPDLLRDLVEIAQISSDDVTETEEEEASLAELEEYLRLAVLTIYTELNVTPLTANTRSVH